MPFLVEDCRSTLSAADRLQVADDRPWLPPVHKLHCEVDVAKMQIVRQITQMMSTRAEYF